MMMDERLKWARKLNNLIKRNSQLARTYKKVIEIVPNATMKKFLSQQIARGMECTRELEEEIRYLESEVTTFKNPLYYTQLRGRTLASLGRNVPLLLGYCIKQKKSIIKRYRRALSRINDGSIREKLMRHISESEEELQELMLLKNKMRSKNGLKDSMLNNG